MKASDILPWLVLSLSPLCRADTFTDAAAKLPACGIACVLQLVPDSACRTFTNTTCLCSDRDLYLATQACVLQNCSVLDGIETARVEAEACQRPVRSRKADLYSALALEIPAILCAFLRIYSRYWATGTFEIDDYIMIVITILFIVFEVLGQYAGAIAFGVDLWTVDEATLTQALKVFFIDESFYLVVLVLSKISVCFFYLRVFPNRWLRMAVYGVMAWVGLSGIIILFMQIFQCMPIDYNWNGWKGGYGAYHCLNVNLLAWVSAGLSIVQDVVILALPLPILFQLNTTWQSKLAIIFMFSLGIFTVITSCIRLRSILMFGSSVNPTWDYSDALIWTGLELSVSMIVISLPAIRALLARTVPGFFGSLKSRATGLSGSAGFSKRSDPQGTLNSRRDDKSVKRQSRFFSVLGSTSNGSHESQLELGDKIHGNVQTEIGAGQKGPRNSTEHLAPTRAEDRRTVSSTSEDAWRTQSLETTSPVSTIGPAIHVKTTMTRTSTSVTADGRGLGKNWVQLKS